MLIAFADFSMLSLLLLRYFAMMPDMLLFIILLSRYDCCFAASFHFLFRYAIDDIFVMLRFDAYAPRL